MRLIGIMPVRNEDWILGLSLRVALQWCDEVVLFLHACDDASLQIVADLQSEVTDRLSYFRCDDREWTEMGHRNALLHGARKEHAATHIALVDADEVLTANLIPNIRGMVEALRPGQMLDLPLYNLREDPAHEMDWRYHLSGVWGSRWLATAFRDSPALNWTGDRFHHREPMGAVWRRFRPVAQGDGGVLHFWGASERRLRAKHALYKITERIRFSGKRVEEIEGYYNQAIAPQPEQILDGRGRLLATRPPQPWAFAPAKAGWLAGYPLDHLHLEREPWQIAECERLYREYGADRFTGLDLFGMVE